MLKTFWTGDGGWADRQLPDGTLIVTTPSGRTYTTRPGASLLFPGWNTTATAPPHTPDSTTPTKPNSTGLMMPKRRRTRAQDRDYRIRAERALNDAHVAERNIPPPC